MALIHYVTFKVNKPEEVPTAERLFQEYYSQIQREILEVQSVDIMKNCVNRASNFDIMIKMKLADEDTLHAYLENTTHRRLMEKTDGLAKMVGGFDCLENDRETDCE